MYELRGHGPYNAIPLSKNWTVKRTVLYGKRFTDFRISFLNNRTFFDMFPKYVSFCAK